MPPQPFWRACEILAGLSRQQIWMYSDGSVHAPVVLELQRSSQPEKDKGITCSSRKRTTLPVCLEPQGLSPTLPIHSKLLFPVQRVLFMIIISSLLALQTWIST